MEEKPSKINEKLCSHCCYCCSPIVTFLLLVLLWHLFDIKISFEFLNKFLDILIQLTAITTLICTIVTVRVEWYPKLTDKNEILKNFRSFMKRFISGIIFFLLLLLLLELFKKYECWKYISVFLAGALSLIIAFLWYYFCGIFSFFREFRGPNESGKIENEFDHSPTEISKDKNDKKS